MRLLLLFTVPLSLLAAGGAGMNPERLARIPARMRAFVGGGTAAGFVTLVAPVTGEIKAFMALAAPTIED